MRSFAIVSIVVSMLLHAVLGCCWHHAHAHTACGDDHHVDSTPKASHVCDEDEHDHHAEVAHGHAHVADGHDDDHAHAVKDETTLPSQGTLASGIHRHEDCPHSHSDACCGTECVFVKSESSRSPQLLATTWLTPAVGAPMVDSPMQIGSWVSVGPDIGGLALPLRAHIALQVFLL